MLKNNANIKKQYLVKIYKYPKEYYMNIKYLLLFSLAAHSTSYSMESVENTTEIWLVRHGETTVNENQNYIGGRSNGAKLNQNGIDQAYALSEYLKTLNLTFDYIYCSTAERTKQTLAYCFPSKEYTQTEALLELDQGDWEGKLRKEIYSREDVVLGLKEDNWNFIPGDACKGESQSQVAQRMKVWITDIAKKHKGNRVIAFYHGLAIKFLIAELFGLPLINMLHLKHRSTIQV